MGCNGSGAGHESILRREDTPIVAPEPDLTLPSTHLCRDVLGEIGDASAVPALKETLEDRSHNVRVDAVEALEKFGDPEIDKFLDSGSHKSIQRQENIRVSL